MPRRLVEQQFSEAPSRPAARRDDDHVPQIEHTIPQVPPPQEPPGQWKKWFVPAQEMSFDHRAPGVTR
jgi:hypothetical protein